MVSTQVRGGLFESPVSIALDSSAQSCREETLCPSSASLLAAQSCELGHDGSDPGELNLQLMQ